MLARTFVMEVYTVIHLGLVKVLNARFQSATMPVRPGMVRPMVTSVVKAIQDNYIGPDATLGGPESKLCCFLDIANTSPVYMGQYIIWGGWEEW